MTRTVAYLAAWLAAAVAAVGVGLLAVTGVGASVRDRGPITGQEQYVQEALEDAEGRAEADPAADRVTETFDGDFGSVVVTCQGAVAFGDAARAAPGWRRVSLERGPDDDIDAVFASGTRSIEIEVYCNAGRPRIGDLEDKTLGEED
ncbi:hypothetical protein ABFT23_17730 [Nocardioides sp. C4-1]|uniref:hypothetical protein n=1 Tax=Nocardioides sp. C4-1 TaxID=3151851 RepID=UPI0032641480